jgi:hypothetical protein
MKILRRINKNRNTNPRKRENVNMKRAAHTYQLEYFDRVP